MPLEKASQTSFDDASAVSGNQVRLFSGDDPSEQR